ncbi:MAG: hypothetical protein V9E82_04015 [Candidatus Nanopelagicales bacterium]
MGQQVSGVAQATGAEPLGGRDQVGLRCRPVGVPVQGDPLVQLLVGLDKADRSAAADTARIEADYLELVGDVGREDLPGGA